MGVWQEQRQLNLIMALRLVGTIHPDNIHCDGREDRGVRRFPLAVQLSGLTPQRLASSV